MSGRWFSLFVGLCLLLPAGCGQSGEKLIPVSGKVTVDGQPLRKGTLSFRPDAAKGNRTTQEPAGEIDAEGSYKLFTGGKPGAPPGWYKVLVIAQEDVPNPKDPYTFGKTLINPKYSSPATTDQAVEVSENVPPGAYDLKLKR